MEDNKYNLPEEEFDKLIEMGYTAEHINELYELFISLIDKKE